MNIHPIFKKKLIYNSNSFDGPTEDPIPNTVKYKKSPFIDKLTNSVVSIIKDFSNIKIAKYNTIKNHNLF